MRFATLPPGLHPPPLHDALDSLKHGFSERLHSPMFGVDPFFERPCSPW